MKIAYVYDAVYPWIKGGAEKRIWEISKRLVKIGHEVHIFGMNYWNGDAVVMKEGVYLHGVCEPKELYVGGRRSIKEAIYFARKVLFPLLKENFDVIDCQAFPYFPCFSAKICSSAKKIPLVITWYEFWGDYWYEYLGKKGIFGKVVEELTLKLPDKIIPISERIKADLLSIGVSDKKMEVVPNGVDFNGIQEMKKEDGEYGYDVLYVGRLSKHKNVDLLLKAMNIIKGELPSIKCRIIGDGPEKENLIRLTRSLNLEENVEFLGFIEKDEDVISSMKSAKVFVLPSTREGFPNTILEANACGLPVIIVKGEKNAAVDVVEDGKNGFICSFSEEDVATKVLALLRDGSKCRKMRDISKAKSKEYDWSIIVNRMEKVYNELAG